MKKSKEMLNVTIFQKMRMSALLLVMILIISSCTTRKTPYSIIEIKGKNSVTNYSKSFYYFSQESDSLHPAFLIVSKGDLISFDDESFFVFGDPTQNSFTFRSKNGIGYLNDKVNSIDISDKFDMIPMFKRLKETDISTLEFINIKSKFNEDYYPYLKEIAKIKPDLGLICSCQLTDMKMLLEIFNPRYIIGAEISTCDFSKIPALTNLELLAGQLKDTSATIPLPAMSRLKQIFLTQVEDKAVLDSFLFNNKQIERVILMKSGIFDASVIKPLAGLKELIVTGFDSIADLDLISNQKKLEVLSLSGEKIRISSSHGGLASLRWMTFSQGSSQTEFKTFIESHPDLEVVEMAGSKEILQLGSLLSLKKLIGLTISDTVTDITSIKSLKSLKYLSLPDKMLKDTLLKADLKRSLPGTKIVANHGFCLGTGWLLLIIPLLLVFRILSLKKSEW